MNNEMCAFAAYNIRVTHKVTFGYNIQMSVHIRNSNIHKVVLFRNLTNISLKQLTFTYVVFLSNP